MRHDQLGGLDHFVTENEEVQVERPLTPTHGSLSAESRLDRPKHAEKGVGLERGLGSGHGVEESALACWASHRCGFVIGTYIPKVDAWLLLKRGDRSIKVRRAVTQVGAQTK